MKDGLRNECRVCHNANSARWQSANPHRKKIYNHNWGKRNQSKKNANWARYHADKLQRTPKWLTKQDYADIDELYATSRELSWLSEDGLQVDHIIPLRGELVSGLHVPSNLRVVPASINQSKGNKLLKIA